MKLVINITRALLLVYLVSISNAQQSCGAGNKCINCMADGCHTCKYKLTKIDRTCGDSLKDDCEVMYEKDKGICSLCKEGYVLDKEKKTCKLTTISKCSFGFLDQKNVEKCSACYDAQLNSDATLCDQKREVGYCDIVGKNKYGGIGCVSCQKGYSMDYMGKCTKECKVGCLTCINGVCQACNHYRGYYDLKPGECEKFSLLTLAYNLMILIVLIGALI